MISMGKVLNLKVSGVFFQKLVLKLPWMGFFWIIPIITSYGIVIIQVLINRCKSKFNTEN